MSSQADRLRAGFQLVLRQLVGARVVVDEEHRPAQHGARDRLAAARLRLLLQVLRKSAMTSVYWMARTVARSVLCSRAASRECFSSSASGGRRSRRCTLSAARPNRTELSSSVLKKTAVGSVSASPSTGASRVGDAVQHERRRNSTCRNRSRSRSWTCGGGRGRRRKQVERAFITLRESFINACRIIGRSRMEYCSENAGNLFLLRPTRASF